MSDESIPTWQRRAAYAWIAAIAIYYYANFTRAFSHANEGAISSLLHRIF